METLKLGLYKIPEGKVAVISHGILTIRESKSRPITDLRCKDCKFFGLGSTLRPQWTTTVCLKKPKKATDKHPDWKLHYHAVPTGKICNMFEEKEK